MGTQLYARGVALDSCFDAQNLPEPALVEAIHRDYILAGAQVIETNTFGANAVKLAAHGLAGQVARSTRGAPAGHRRPRKHRRAGVRGRRRGPAGQPLWRPLARSARADAVAIFAEQIEALVGAGVDLLMLETFADLEELAAAIAAARAVCDLPIVAQMTFTEDDLTPLGAAPGRGSVTRLIGAGRRCDRRQLQRGAPTYAGRDPAHGGGGAPAALLSGAAKRRLALAGGRPHRLSVVARLYRRHCSRLIEAGARLVGGCCGTTPEHIRALARVLGAPRHRLAGGRRAACRAWPKPRPRAAPETAPTPARRRRAPGWRQSWAGSL